MEILERNSCRFNLLKEATDYMTKGFVSINQEKRNRTAWPLIAKPIMEFQTW